MSANRGYPIAVLWRIGFVIALLPQRRSLHAPSELMDSSGRSLIAITSGCGCLGLLIVVVILLHLLAVWSSG